MSDTPEVPQPVFSKATHVPPPVAHTSTTLNGGRGAPAPNGVGRGFGRGDRGDLSPVEGASGTNRTNGDCDLPSPPTNTGVGRRAAAIFRLLAPRGDPRGELPSSCPLRTRDARSDASHPPDSRTRRRGGPGPTSVDHARGVAHAVGASTARIPPAQKNPSTRRGFGCTNAFVEAAPTRRATDSRCKTRQLTPLFPRPPPLLVTKTDARSTMNPNNGVPPPRVPPPHQPHGLSLIHI